MIILAQNARQFQYFSGTISPVGRYTERGVVFLDDASRNTLKGQLSAADQALFFLLLLILSLLLSFRSAARQKAQILDLLCGESSSVTDTEKEFHLRVSAGALVVGSLGFFLCLALNALDSTDPSDKSAARSAQVNAAASVLVFLAAVLRLDDTLRGSSSLPEDDLLPE